MIDLKMKPRDNKSAILYRFLEFQDATDRLQSDVDSRRYLEKQIRVPMLVGKRWRCVKGMNIKEFNYYIIRRVVGTEKRDPVFAQWSPSGWIFKDGYIDPDHSQHATIEVWVK